MDSLLSDVKNEKLKETIAMPRAKRTPAKAKAEKVEKAVNEKVVEEKVKEKTRKPYPSIDERIALADAKIQQLEKLNATRQALVEKTAAVLAERQETLAKSQERAGPGACPPGAADCLKDKPAKAHRAVSPSRISSTRSCCPR